jgi:hypothetical protein
LQDRYESAYLSVCGDLKKPLSAKQVPFFLESLFPSFPYRFSRYNVSEMLRCFGRDGAKTKLLFWPDIRKGLREHKGQQGDLSRKTLIKSVFNPDATALKFWCSITYLLAFYHFLVVPIRISFLPWKSMLDEHALYTDLVADGFTIMNFVIKANTAYLNSRAMWITNRYKIIRRIDGCVSVSAIPFDW